MPFAHALHFLTRLRIPGARQPSLHDVAASQGWFAAVGLLIGACLLVVDRIAGRALPDASIDVILVVALALITGALHLDGLADAADGLFGGQDAKSRMDIMHDVHRGTYAIVAVTSVLALKWAGLVALPADVRVEALLVVPCAARFAMVLAIAAFPYARADGIGSPFHARASVPSAACAVTLIVAAVVLLGAGGVYVAVAAAASALAIGAYATRQVGGMTGDLYGATTEVTEAALFLFIAALAGRGWIDALALG